MSTDACSNVFVGLDWAVHTHAVCVIDAAGAVLDRFEIAHDRDGLAELMRRLARFGARVRIAIERPSGLIVDALVEAGHHVFPIHPNAVKASRPRYRSHGAKSDASDAYLLADLLRTDGHRWRELSPQSDSIRALRALVRSPRRSGRPPAWRWATSCAARSKPSGPARPASSPTSPRLSAWRSCAATHRPRSAARLSAATLGRFCQQPALQRPSQPSRAAGAAAQRRRRPGRPAHDRGGRAVGARAWSPCSQPLVTQIAELTASHRALRRVAARRTDHHVLPARRPRLRSADPGRVG